MGEITFVPEAAMPFLRELPADVRPGIPRPLPKLVQDTRRTGAPSGAALAFHPLFHPCELHVLKGILQAGLL